jgi:uncharacterized protein YciI
MIKLLFGLFAILPLTLPAQEGINKKRTTSKSAAKAGEVSKPEAFEPISLFFVMLSKGSKRDQDSITADQIQKGHMANITQLTKSGKLLLAGPFMDDADWRGIFILKCDTKEEAEELVKKDPAVAAGRLNYEIHSWLTGKNCLFK